MKKIVLTILFLLVAVSLVSAAPESVFPAPALSGATGLIRIPSANVIPYKNFNVAFDYGAVIPSGSSSPAQSIVNYKMNLGTFHNVEVGIVGGTDPTTNKLREGVFVNMKLSLASGDEPYPLLLAIGTENLFSYTQTDVYMVATKYFKQGPKATFGFMADFPNYRFRPLGIAGIESALGDTLFVLADVLAGETLFQVDAGLRYYLTPLVAITLSGLNVLDGGQVKDQRTVFVSLSWANPF